MSSILFYYHPEFLEKKEISLIYQVQNFEAFFGANRLGVRKCFIVKSITLKEMQSVDRRGIRTGTVQGKEFSKGSAITSKEHKVHPV